MAITIHVESQTGMAIVTASGTLSADDAREGAAMLWKHPDWPGQSAVWDLREAEFAMASSDPMAIAQFVKQKQPATPPKKMAFVTRRDVDFGMARMFEAFRSDPRTAVRIFRDYDEAVSWTRSLEPDPD